MYESKAREILAQIIAANQANGFAGIDRSPAGIAQRHERMKMGSSPNSRFGDKDEGIGSDLEQHVINGDLTSDQAVDVLMVLYGLGG
ncbi:hypothetical protein [Suttonella indologenes]|uniref:Uncharacterized protein n=1 Tax=Suttonella indologenes TaxID=13276 RepID=A0A380N3G1_9GAMM|nr:hypothetical protein [Suttonella indologenes]SUO98337.1 Uncharacterised protein [Suttonella indologenes]